MSSVASRSKSLGKIARHQKADHYPIINTLRLMIPKIGVGYLFAMLLSVYNRVMINELKIAATLVGLMYLIYNLMSILQVVNGRYADRRAIFGLRRTPLMFIGLMLSAVALVFLPATATNFAGGNALAFAGMLAIMVLFGFGFAMNGDSHNTLIAEQTEGKKNRSGVISMVWVFTIFSTILCSISASIVLRNAEIAAGAPPGCTTDACRQIHHDVVLATMPKLFLAGPVIALIGLLPLIGLERRLTPEEVKTAKQRPPLHIKQAFTRIFTNSQARVFFFFIVTSIFALFLQDDILEPAGADVFKLSASQTAQFQPVMGSMTILAMLVMGFIASRKPIAKRTIANWGALMAATGFGLLAVSVVSHLLPLWFVSIAVLGAGMGVFNIGALSMMMDMTVPGETGSLMGAWGMAQALANGSSQFAGGFLRDTGLHLTGSAAITYSFIFLISTVLCVVAINLMARVNIEKFRKMTREQMGLAIEAA
jgi:BCD family chlorophyll transporter-like MFS transporter